MPQTKTIAQPETANDCKGDFRLFLENELTKRCRKNPSYSLRSFSKLIGVESSRLSKILRRERPVTLRLIPQIGQRLGLSQRDILAFVANQETLKKSAATEKVPTNTYHQLPLDVFESIEDWRHYAILELMKVKGFEANARWVAKTLGITVSEAHAYIARLERVGLLEIQEDGTWKDLSMGFSTHVLSENESSYAHRRAQKGILERASDALDRVPFEERDQSSMLMAIGSEKIIGAKKMITKFRRELCAYLEKTESKDSVYQLSISLFPVIEKKGARHEEGN